MRRFWRLIAYSSDRPAEWYAPVLLLALAHTAGLAVPYLVKSVVDATVRPQGTWYLIAIAVLWLLLQTTQALAQYRGQLALTRFGEAVQRRLRERALAAFLDRPLPYHLGHPVSDQISLLEGDTAHVNRLCAAFIPAFIGALVGIGGTTFVLWLLEPQILYLALIPAPLALIGALVYRKRSHAYATALRQTSVALFLHEKETFEAIGTVQAYGLGPWVSGRIGALAERSEAVSNTRAQFVARLGVILSLGSLVILGALLLASHYVLAGKLSLGDLVAAYAYLLMVLFPLRLVPLLLTEWGQGLVAADRLLALFEEPHPETARPPETSSHIDVAGPWSVSFNNVTFSYPPATGQPMPPPVLAGLSFSVAAGECLYIAGGSGSGKTTTARLLAQLLLPERGEIRLNHIPQRLVPHQVLQQRIAYVEEDVILFSGTIRDNILAGIANLPQLSVAEREAALAKAVRVAQVQDLLDLRHCTLAAPVAREGAQLSLGQRKRVALARALIRDPALLILDQLAADLDDQTSERIFSLLRHEYRATLIYLGHRLPPGLSASAARSLNRDNIPPA